MDLDYDQLAEEFLDHHNEDLMDQWKLLMSSNDIQDCVKNIAHRLNQKFKNSDRPIVIVGILKGVYMFMADLTRQLTFPYSVYFINTSSYQGQTQGKVKIVDELEPSKFFGKTVIILDELFDKGETMNTVKNYLINEIQVPSEECHTCVLYTKKSKTEYDLPDFIGLEGLPAVWLVGYGLDDQGEKRGWDALFAVPKSGEIPKTEDDQMFEDNNFLEEERQKIQKKIGWLSKNKRKNKRKNKNYGTPGWILVLFIFFTYFLIQNNNMC